MRGFYSFPIHFFCKYSRRLDGQQRKINQPTANNPHFEGKMPILLLQFRSLSSNFELKRIMIS